MRMTVKGRRRKNIQRHIWFVEKEALATREIRCKQRENKLLMRKSLTRLDEDIILVDEYSLLNIRVNT